MHAKRLPAIMNTVQTAMQLLFFFSYENKQQHTLCAFTLVKIMWFGGEGIVVNSSSHLSVWYSPPALPRLHVF
jgi:hypothetical protein